MCLSHASESNDSTVLFEVPPADRQELLLIGLPSTILPSGAHLLYPLVTLLITASESNSQDDWRIMSFYEYSSHNLCIKMPFECSNVGLQFSPCYFCFSLQILSLINSLTLKTSSLSKVSFTAGHSTFPLPKTTYLLLSFLLVSEEVLHTCTVHIS